MTMKKLAVEGYRVVFLLGPAELERFSEETISRLAKAGNVQSGLSLDQVVALLSWADGFIGNDSGLTHLAGAMGVKTVAVFSPTDERVYRPIGPAVSVLRCEADGFCETGRVEQQQQAVELLIG